jgi:tetratricopeptide (TPR) repeat protein
LWSEDYNRELEHIFEVQDDVSQKIATNLLSAISTQEIEEIRTNRPKQIENYDYYMQARGFHTKFINTQKPEYLNDAILLLKEILKQEPDYVSANAELADAYNTYYNFLAQTDEEKRKYMRLQKKYFDIANRLNPKDFDVQRLKMNITLAEEELEYFGEKRLNLLTDYLKINPNDAFTNVLVGNWLSNFDLKNKSLSYLNKAEEFDPLFTWIYDNRGWAYFALGKFEKAESDFIRLMEIDSSKFYNYLTYLIYVNRLQEAEKLINHWQDKNPDRNRLELNRAKLFAAKDDKENALVSFNKITFYGFSEKYYELAIIYLLLNDQEKAIETIIEDEKDRSSKGVRRSRYWIYLNYPCYKILHNNPRFRKIVAKHKELYEENLRKYRDIDK